MYLKHGMSKSPEYQAWRSMRARCSNPSFTEYAIYGGRGIRVCEEWCQSFEAFLAHVGHRPGPGYSLDRIDVNGNYEPGNVRWATRREQQQNMRKNVNVTYNGETLCISEWARRIGIDHKTLASRLASGMTVADAMKPPTRRDPALVGVSQAKRTGRWCAYYNLGQGRVWVGNFDTKEEAMAARDAAIAAGRGKRQEAAADDLDGVDLDLVGAE
jgi:hypothetical protein